MPLHLHNLDPDTLSSMLMQLLIQNSEPTTFSSMYTQLLDTHIKDTHLFLNTNNNNNEDEYTGYSGKASKIENIDGVINISSEILTPGQISLLSKGLSFCPTPKSLNLWDLKSDFDKLHRNIKLKYFFSDPDLTYLTQSQPTITPTLNSQPPNNPGTSSTPQTNVDGVPKTSFRNPSTWIPSQTHANIHTFATVNMANLTALPQIKPRFHNLTKSDKLALETLKSNNSIIIKPADKGAGVVIMNTKDYIFEAFKQLNSTSYIKSSKEHLVFANNEVAKILTDLLTEDQIDKHRFEYLFQKSPKPGKFYLLPKIHKNTLPPPGRPIVSQIGSPTERISGYLDFFLQPFLQKIPSYLKDTGHFLHTIEEINQKGPLPPNTLLVTLDVTSLYTNIPILEAKQSVAKALIELRGNNNTPSNKYLLQLLDLILKHNIFTFSTGKELFYYLQVIGIAMGTKAAVAIANIFMHYFETRHIYNNKHISKPHIYKRFIDDIFMIWTKSRPELTQFIQTLNTTHNSIKFTASISDTQIEFLDTVVILQDGILQTELYIKPTNAQSYLHRNSYHPKHIFNSLPYGEFLRTRRNCSSLASFDKHAHTMYQAFTKRGYQTSLLDEALVKARAKPREQLLEKYKQPQLLNQAFTQLPQVPPDLEKFFFTTKYHDGLNPVKKILRDNWYLLGKSPETESLYESKLVLGFKRNARLKDLLVHTQIPISSPTPGKAGKIIRECPDPSTCKVCLFMDTTGKIKSFTYNKSFHSRKKAYCISHNIIYCLQCNTCGKQYVGQTKRELGTRFNEHLKDLNLEQIDEKTKPVAKHLKRPDHTGKIDQVTCFVLDFIKAPGDSSKAKLERNEKERIWISRLGTIRPRGLNKLEPKSFT